MSAASNERASWADWADWARGFFEHDPRVDRGPAAMARSRARCVRRGRTRGRGSASDRRDRARAGHSRTHACTARDDARRAGWPSGPLRSRSALRVARPRHRRRPRHPHRARHGRGFVPAHGRAELGALRRPSARPSGRRSRPRRVPATSAARTSPQLRRQRIGGSSRHAWAPIESPTPRLGGLTRPASTRSRSIRSTARSQSRSGRQRRCRSVTSGCFDNARELFSPRIP